MGFAWRWVLLPPFSVSMVDPQQMHEVNLDGWVGFGREALERAWPPWSLSLSPASHSPFWSWLVAQTALGWQGIGEQMPGDVKEVFLRLSTLPRAQGRTSKGTGKRRKKRSSRNQEGNSGPVPPHPVEQGCRAGESRGCVPPHPAEQGSWAGESAGLGASTCGPSSSIPRRGLDLP